MSFSRLTRPFFVQLIICIFVAAVTMFAHIKKRNELTELSLVIPRVELEVKNLQRENSRLQYEIDSLESPIRMMEYARQPDFGHLKYPYIRDVIILKEGKDALLE
jgi:cell division protein FtsL